MRNFKIEDFEGCGQYIIRADREHYTDAGFMSTIMKKVGWLIGTSKAGRQEQRVCLIDMSDGLITDGYFINKDEKGNRIEDTQRWIWISFEKTEEDRFADKRTLINYLNNPNLSQEYRFATHEEVMHVILNQKHRTKG